jgi:hypothetical protein
MKHKGLGMDTRKELTGAEYQAYGKARHRGGGGGVSTTRAAAPALRSRFPAQTHFDRKTAKPGFFAPAFMPLTRRRAAEAPPRAGFARP